MEGRIKFVDPKTQKWGFIIPSDKSRDVHFDIRDFVGPAPSVADADAPVAFELVEQGTSREAKRIQLLAPPTPVPPTPATASSDLRTWAWIPFVPFTAKDHRSYPNALALLASQALPERWHFGDQDAAGNSFPILRSYLTYTFVKLRHENKVFESVDGKWAAFNTGLVDKLYDPIFALFERNRRAPQPWAFCDFCVPGKRNSGKQLTAAFDPLPEPAKYFNSTVDMLFDTSRDIYIDYEHVILDGIRQNRFPVQFLREHLPERVDWQDPAGLTDPEWLAFLGKLSDGIESDDRCMRAIKRRLEDAKLLAEKRIRWNFKTAIPQYYPRFNLMSLLLPLALINDEVVDIALVVTKNPSGSYLGRTILPLDWAYKNARLVCRPDSDWLVPQRVQAWRDSDADLGNDDAADIAHESVAVSEEAQSR
jgi:hypothetical protein